jgi:hypothetical protein
MWMDLVAPTRVLSVMHCSSRCWMRQSRWENRSVQISDVTIGGYCLSSLSAVAAAISADSGESFQAISVPIHSVATAAYAFLRYSKESSASHHFDAVKECRLLVQSCREFNASVLPSSEGLRLGIVTSTSWGRWEHFGALFTSS